MAATAMTPAQLELIESLSQDDIPIKLRCAICSKLAVNAFRLPCCEQAICETCQASLPSSCPVCEHSPVTPDDCTPHKSLRTTIKVFLRTEEKKRSALLAKAAKETPPDTPIEAIARVQIPETTRAATPAYIPQAADDEELAPGPETEAGSHIKEENAGDTTLAIIPLHENQQDIPHESIEEIAPGHEQQDDKSNADDASTSAGDGNDMTEAVAGVPNAFTMPGMNPMMGIMGGGDMNQMQQMQLMMAMQSGMGGMGGFGGFPMMGMPGMPMDPMTMQSMYMNGGYGGMNMSMGGQMGNMGGYGDGNGGQEAWNGQQAWNGVDNFNANNAAGHTDFGSSHYPNRGGAFGRGGYGRGGYDNFGGHQQDFSYGRGRGRGRGRGGFGRGGWQQQNEFQSHGGWNAGMNGMSGMNGMDQTMGGQQQDIPKDTLNAEPNPNVDEFGREIRAATPDEGNAKTGDGAASVETVAEIGEPGTEPHQDQENDPWAEDNQNGGAGEYNNDQPNFDWSNGQGQGYYAGNSGYNQQHQGQGFNGYNQNIVTPQPVDVPINAPTGPKAMREGLPNIGLVHLKGRKGSSGKPYASTSGANNIEVADRSKKDYTRDDRDRSRDKDGERSDRHSHRRHRDEEMSDDARESERRRERRRRRREEAEAAAGVDTTTKDADVNDIPSIEAAEGEDRARSASPTESKRGSHRSRRDKERSDRHSDRDRHRDRSRHRDRDDKDRDREREKDKDYKSSSSKHRSSHRSHRDRSRSRDKDDSKSSRSRRDRDRDDDRDHRSSRRHRDEEPVLKPPTGPKSMSIFDNKGPSGGIQIKGSSSRRPQSQSELGKENAASGGNGSVKKDVDPHTAEREARNRERLLKEAQRMAGLAGLVGAPPSGARKRERGEEKGGRRKRRGKSGGGFDGADDEVAEEDEEERIRRNEREREGARGR